MKLEIYNSITKQSIALNILKTNVDNKKNINVIYASNGVGKSSLANIIDCALTSKGADVVNRFDNEVSSVKLIENLENIKNIYKYDRAYVLNSSDIYNEKLIVAPKIAQRFVELSQKNDSVKNEFVKNYKSLREITDILSKKKVLLSKTRLSNLTTKTTDQEKVGGILNELAKISEDKLKDTRLTIVDILEIKEYLDDDLLSKFDECKRQIDDLIKEQIPEISSIDFDLYEAIYAFLKGNESFVGSKCLMCGDTIFTEGKIAERCIEIKGIIEMHNKKSSNQVFAKYKSFCGNDYESPILNKLKCLLKTVNANNITDISLQASDVISDIDASLIRSSYEEHILNLVLAKNGISKLVGSYNENLHALAKLEKDYEARINENIIIKFKNLMQIFGFKYFEQMQTILNPGGMIEITFHKIQISELYNEILSESEKTILSLSLFLAIADTSNALIIIDDPVDSHDQKNKYFIINQIYDFVSTSDVLALVLTHDMSLSQICSYIGASLLVSNSLLTRNGLIPIVPPSIYFEPIYSYIYSVSECIRSVGYADTKNLIIPISILLRYLSNFQKKFYKDIIICQIDQAKPLNASIIINRSRVREIGFDKVSEQVLHYNDSFNANDLIVEIGEYFQMDFCGNVMSTLSTNMDTIGMLVIIRQYLNNPANYPLKNIPQFAKEFSLMIHGIILRVGLEKKMLNGATRTSRQELDDIALSFRAVNSSDHALYQFYSRNKPILNDFCHLESGIEVMFDYHDEDIKELIDELNSISV